MLSETNGDLLLTSIGHLVTMKSDATRGSWRGAFVDLDLGGLMAWHTARARELTVALA